MFANIGSQFGCAPGDLPGRPKAVKFVEVLSHTDCGAINDIRSRPLYMREASLAIQTLQDSPNVSGPAVVRITTIRKSHTSLRASTYISCVFIVLGLGDMEYFEHVRLQLPVKPGNDETHTTPVHSAV